MWKNVVYQRDFNDTYHISNDLWIYRSESDLLMDETETKNGKVVIVIWRCYVALDLTRAKCPQFSEFEFFWLETEFDVILVFKPPQIQI